MMIDADLIRMGFLLAALSGNIYLSNLANPGAYGSVADAVRLGAYVVLWSAAYMWLSALWQQRPVVNELPRMSLTTVTVYVYGLGVLAFVTTYTFLCVSVPCVFGYLASATCLCGSDLVDSPGQPMAGRVVLALAAVGSLASVICVMIGDPYSQELAASLTSAGRVGDVLYGYALPLACPFLYHFTRDPRRVYSPRVVFELIHFAMPFAVILALVTLAITPPADVALTITPPADGPGLHHPPGPPRPGPEHHRAQQWVVYIAGDNVTRLEIPLSSTIASGFTGLTAADFAVAALPLSAVLVLFFAIQSVLLYSTADFLTAAAFVNAAKFFACQPSDPGAIVAMSLAAVALMLRVCSSTACEAEPQTLPVYMEAVDIVEQRHGPDWGSEPQDTGPAGGPEGQRGRPAGDSEGQ